MPLLEEATDLAVQEGHLDVAASLMARRKALGPLSPQLTNLDGLIALRQKRLIDAAAAFDLALASGIAEPEVRFNRAWVHALQGDFDATNVLLDDATAGVSPRAASLKVQALHHLGDLTGAIEAGEDLLERFPEDNGLLGALSVAAIDSFDYELARSYAMRATGGADALTTQGLVALNDDDGASALLLFDKALKEAPSAPRAWLGRGLSLLAHGDIEGAAPCLQKGAQIFGDHLGSWIALGWTHFLRKDYPTARQSFDTAMGHDENFAETHGALAVLDIVENRIESARRRTDIALRLDRNCFGGTLARSLLLEMEGKPEFAAKIRTRAMNMPVGVEGKTLAQAMFSLASAKGNAPSTKTLQ